VEAKAGVTVEIQDILTEVSSICPGLWNTVEIKWHRDAYRVDVQETSGLMSVRTGRLPCASEWISR
jgi:hypothetical protein